MASKASVRSLRPGQRSNLTNDTGKPLRVVLQGPRGMAVSTTLSPGGVLDISAGEEAAKLFLFEPEAHAEHLRLVDKD